MAQAAERADTARQEVARATWAVVEREGLSGASMREIAREAGCTTGVLTHYFRDKDELMLFAFSLAFEAAADRMREQAQKHTDGRRALTAVLEEVLPLDAQRRVEAAIYFGFLDVARRDARLADEFRRRHETWRKLLAQLVRDATRVGAARAGDHADLLLVAVDGIASSALAEPRHYNEARQRALLRRTVDSLIGPQGA